VYNYEKCERDCTTAQLRLVKKVLHQRLHQHMTDREYQANYRIQGVYKTPSICYAVNQYTIQSTTTHAKPPHPNADIFSAVVYAVHHPVQNMTARIPAEGWANLRCSIPRLDSYVPSAAKIVAELHQTHCRKGD
jgi:hypothetical protein